MGTHEVIVILLRERDESLSARMTKSTGRHQVPSTQVRNPSKDIKVEELVFFLTIIADPEEIESMGPYPTRHHISNPIMEVILRRN